MKRLTKKELSRIHVDVNKNGFTVWIRDTEKGIDHWILDGSCVKEDGEIRLALPSPAYKIAVIPDGETVRLVKPAERKKKVKK